MMRKMISLMLALTLAACTPVEGPPDRRAGNLGTLPAMKTFAATRVTPPARPNATTVEPLDRFGGRRSGRPLKRPGVASEKASFVLAFSLETC